MNEVWGYGTVNFPTNTEIAVSFEAMKKSLSYFTYFLTVFGSFLVAAMIVLDVILFPSETDTEPWYYFFFLCVFILATAAGCVLSFWYRNPFTTSKKEKIFSYIAISAGVVLFAFPFIDVDEKKYLTLGAFGIGLMIVGIVSLLSTELGLMEKAKYRVENLIYKAFPDTIRQEVSTVVRWLKRRRQLKSGSVLRTSFYDRKFGGVLIPFMVSFRDEEYACAPDLKAETVYWCLQTRNRDGVIREKCLCRILESDYPSWAIPFIIEASTDPVVGVVAAIYEKMKGKANDKIRTYYRNDLKKFRHDYSKTISYWNEYYRHNYPEYKDYPGYKLFTECYGFKKRYYKEADRVTVRSKKLNKLWDLYFEEKLDGTPFLLCDYFSGVQSEGHSCFFFNVNNARSDHPLREYVIKLEGILPENLYNNLVCAVNAYRTRKETAVCEQADSYFFSHEYEYMEILEKYAAAVVPEPCADGG